MNISVDEINIVNDGMYEIYTKFGMKIAIDVLKKRFRLFSRFLRFKNKYTL